jgi:hypothetical protein
MAYHIIYLPVSRPVATLSVVAALIAILIAAGSVDVARSGFGVKGDEATYGSMALSLAFDHDMSYQRADLERFRALYGQGPEGIFLKRGEQWHFHIDGTPPFWHIDRVPDPPDSSRLYFGKAFIYSLFAAPFVRLFGLNGFLIFHALLMSGVILCGYTFLSARSRAGPALGFTLAFVGLTVVPIYAVFFTSDIFNFALVFYAYFLWLYKEVAPRQGWRFLRSYGSDLAAAVLLGIATFSKPFNLVLIAPPVLLFWWRHRFRRGLVVGVVFALATAALFGANAWTSGEFNYQGGEDRRTFYGHFPFDESGGAFDRGIQSATNDSDAESVLKGSEFVNRFAHNVEYFFVGRHFGFVPYFFPGFVGLCLWLFSRERFTAWRLLALFGLVASTLAVLVLLPYTWSGGGGPPGNRYFLNLYPVVFFLVPPLRSMTAPVVAGIGGALFTAHMLMHPFVTAKYTYLMSESGPARILPVELTMPNDLPVALSSAPVRAHIPYGDDPVMLLYFLDQNAFPPEPMGMWVGNHRADIIVRTEDPLDHLVITAESPIQTTLTVSAGAEAVTVPIAPNAPVHFNVPARGVRGFQSYEYLMSAKASEAFVPHLLDPKSGDYRTLGAQLRFSAVRAVRAQASR